MTASFLEQMKNDYSLIGMLSTRKYSPSPLWGGAGVGCNLRKDPTLSSLCSDVPPHKGEGKRHPRICRWPQIAV